MIDSIISVLQQLPPAGVLAIAFFVAYIENLFPPSPSDVLLVFIGTLVGLGVVGFYPVLLAATAGSTLGFVSAYWAGHRYGYSLIERGWLPFITMDLLEKVNRWFARYHDWIIVGNRFLAGTRAVIAFAAGITHMPLLRTTILSALSATVWNAILLLAGQLLGEQWTQVQAILSTYGWIVTGAIVLVASGYFLMKHLRKPKPPTSP
ncbi:MAG: DedA family protein [Bradyrhizobiaceae bacterium]|nr:DedA family protein [Bradyrhizobiaceae bacterium]